MLKDAYDDSTALDLHASVLIVGGGLVGLTLGLELAKVTDVTVIESGGSSPDCEAEALNQGTCVGRDYPIRQTRTRQLGGSLALWAGWITPFDEHDFALRPGVEVPGWPFCVDAIRPYYGEASHRLSLPDTTFDARELARAAGVPLPIDNEVVRASAWRLAAAPRRLSTDDCQQLATSKRLLVITRANVVDLKLTKHGDRVSEVSLRTLLGRSGRATAKLVVLACGGLETPRLLLNATRQDPRGVANRSGWVGRAFMEHPHQPIPRLMPRQPELFRASTHPVSDPSGRRFMLHFGLTPHVQHCAGVLNARMHAYRTPELADVDSPRLGLFLEQAPNAESRLILNNQHDRLGMRRIALDWRLSTIDRHTSQHTRRVVREALHAAALVTELDRGDGASRCLPFQPSNHHLGTTRMSIHPADGVVDPNCRCHDIENLYLIGGNVYPTGSWANPTFTLLCLTYRLAAHLRDRLSGSNAAEESRIQSNTEN